MAIDPSFAIGGVGGAEFQVGAIAPAAGQSTGGGGGGGGFGAILTDAVSRLDQLQGDAAGAAQTLATGTATDAAAVVNAVEHARLAMQLASQIRNKAVEAYQDIFHTQI